MRVHLGLLGPTLVRVGDQAIEIGGPRQRRLVAALGLDAGQVVSADQLIDRIWSDGELPANPRATLRTYLTRLRQSLGNEEALITEEAGWRIALDQVSVDTRQFEVLVDRAADLGLDVHTRIARLDEALHLWRGDPFEEVAGDEWARPERDRLEELRITAQERRFEAMLAAGMHTDALPDLAAVVERHRFRDRLVGLQMLAMFRSGRQADASRVFQNHRRRLADEVGLEPGADLLDLDRRILAADPSLHLGSVAGRPLRGYRLGEQLGEGAFAVVYRGTQPSVGRDVAVKVIRSELANRPEFIRQFEAEAQLVAQVEHPHIVPLYDYWREPDRACLVFRYLRGGTLEAQLTAAGGLGADDVGQLVGQVGSALSVAHAAGVVHRDVKPANIFLDETGNFYLGDFGIARGAAEQSDPTAALSAGSPAYAAPEQLRREEVGPAADIHALAITTYEALTVRLPFPDAQSHADLLRRQLSDPIPAVTVLRPELPAAVDEVLARATAKDPGARFQTVEEFAAEFRRALAIGDDVDHRPPRPGRRGVATAVSVGEAANPFKGLRPFTEADAADFRGRERLTDRLVEGLSQTGTAGRIAVVVGPSGIGKSSLVRAGLLPALRQGRVPGSDQWFLATMLPGRDPFDELGAALLRVASRTPDNMMSLLDQDHRGLNRVVKAILPEDGAGEILLVIDQFEELFTLGTDEARRQRFLDAVEYAVTDSRCPLRVVLTIRADFWDRPLRHASFARLIEPSTVNVSALAPDELERAIVEPVMASGCELEPGLVSEIVADVADEPGALPLLQYALTELWERQISGLLTRDAYQALGGVPGALARRAEEVHEEASADEQLIIRRLFSRLVTLGEGSEDTRRRALRSELVPAPGAEAVIDRFGRARLLSFDREPGSREPTVEVAHEALLRQWPRLRSWLDDDRDGLRIHRHLSDSSTAWLASGRDDGELYRGGRLEAAEAWAEDHDDDLNEQERAFLHAGLAARRVEEQARQERLVQQVRANRRLRGLLAGVAVLLTVSLVAGAVAFQQRSAATAARDQAQVNADLAAERAIEAEAQTALAVDERERADAESQRAETRRMVADAAATVQANADVALLLAAEAYRREPGPVTIAGLQRVLSATGPYLGVIGRGETFLSGDWLDDGTIVGLTEQSVRLHDPVTREQLAEYLLPAPVVVPLNVEVAFDVAGRVIAVGTTDGSVVVLEASDDGTLEPAVLQPGDSPVTAVGLSPGQDLVAIGDQAGELHLLERSTAQERWRTQVVLERSFADVMTDEELAAVPGLISFDDLVFNSGVRDLAFAPDGSILVGAGVHLRRVDVTSGEIIDEVVLRSRPNPAVPPIPRFVTSLAIDPGGSVSAAVGTNGFATLDPDLTNLSIAIVPTGRTMRVSSATFGVDSAGVPWFGLNNGQLVRGTVDTVDADAQRLVTGLAAVRSVTTSPDGGVLMAAGHGGLELWAADGRQLIATAFPHRGNNELFVAADGLTALASNVDLGLDSVVYDLSGPAPRAQVSPSVPMSHVFRLSPDPLARYVTALPFTSLVPGSSIHQILLDRETLAVVDEISFPDGTVPTMSDDGSILVWGTSHLTVEMLHFPSGEPAAPPVDLSPWRQGEFDFVSMVDLDASGERLLASLNTGATLLYEVDGWNLLGTIAPDDGGGAVTARFLPDGDSIITRNLQGSITLRDGDTLAPIGELPAGASAAEALSTGPYVSADGEYLLTVREQEPRLIHIPSATEIGTFPNDAGMVAHGADVLPELQLITGVGDHAVVWDLDVESWPEIACRAAGRNLTEAEWHQFGPVGEPLQATCAQWASPG